MSLQSRQRRKRSQLALHSYRGPSASAPAPHKATWPRLSQCYDADCEGGFHMLLHSSWQDSSHLAHGTKDWWAWLDGFVLSFPMKEFNFVY